MSIPDFVDTYTLSQHTGLTPRTIRSLRKRGVIVGYQFVERGKLMFDSREIVRTLKRLNRVRAQKRRDEQLGKTMNRLGQQKPKPPGQQPDPAADPKADTPPEASP
jgi:DNA-binding transcriptional MerR regulator